MEIENFDSKVRAYALKNAISHGGRAQQGAVVSGLFAEGFKSSDVKEYGSKISKIVKEINELSLEEQEVLFENHSSEVSKREVREGLEELPNSETGVVMRIAPSPSGALHIGHAVTGSINIVYVNKYGGKFICRIEDTNPEGIYEPSYDLIKEDIEWLSKGNVEYYIQSDRMEIYYKYAEKLIGLGSAYVCECSQEKFKQISQSKKECPCRDSSVKENLKKWEKMLSKNGFGEGEVVLRFKTPKKYEGMKNKNPAMRDFPLARINETKHPRQGNKYRVWPLMNLAVVSDDIEMGLTHIIRGKEHADNAKRQRMIFEVLKKEYPWSFFMGKLHLKGLKISKRGIREAIESGEYSGWDDPLLPTIQSLKKKYRPEAFWKFAEKRGLSEVDKTMDEKEFFSLLDRYNKEE